MGSFISIGKYNKLYKYIWMFLIIKLIYEYLFDGNLPNEIKIKYFTPEKFPRNFLIQESFNYFGTFLFSIILYKYEMSQRDNKNRLPSNSNSDNNNVSFSHSSSQIELIFSDDIEQHSSTSFGTLLFTTNLLTFSIQLANQLYIINLSELDFWMFEILFLSYITSKMFGTQIYKHKKIAICIIIFLPIIFKILTINEILQNKDEDFLYKKYKWILPIGSITFLINTFLRDYSICKMKWFLDYKYYSVSRILMIYGICGFLMCMIGSIISSFIKCVGQSAFDKINLICTVNIYDNDNDNITYYYDSFKIYFRDLWKYDTNTLINVLYNFFIIIKILTFFFNKIIYYFDS